MMTVSSAPQAPVASAELLADMLAEQLAQQLAVDGDELDRGAPFASFGLKSKDVVAVASGAGNAARVQARPGRALQSPDHRRARGLPGAARVVGARDHPEARRARGSGRAAERRADSRSWAWACASRRGVNDAEQLWRVLDQGLDLVTEIPRERWDAQAYYDPDPDAVGRMITRCGGFLDQHDRFDPAFFGISEREACGMDPQQRVLMEVTWEALGARRQSCPPRSCTATPACSWGLIYREYEQIAGAEPSQLNGYVATGNASSVGSGRISYCLGLRGPSLSVDTACSSSLVALHLACQSLRAGECSLALAGGASLLLTPGPQIEMSRQRVLAPDGRSKTFDAAADGATWSEGAGVLVLKRLSAAQAQGDRILAVVRGTAVNQDGRSSGLTAPYGPSQEAVVRRARAQRRPVAGRHRLRRGARYGHCARRSDRGAGARHGVQV